MPKIVDHDRRRDEIADAALALIARSGIRAITTRSVAEEAGWSTGVLAHYFSSSKDLLIASLRRAAELQGRTLRSYRDKSGLSHREALEELVESFLPFDDRRLALCRIFLVFYAEAAADEQMNAEINEYLDGARRVFQRTARKAQATGLIERTIDTDDAAADLVALLEGLSIHALLDPQVMDSYRARSNLAEVLVNRLFPRPPASTSAS